MFLTQVGGHFDAATPLQPGDPRPVPPSQAEMTVTLPQADALDEDANTLWDEFNSAAALLESYLYEDYAAPVRSFRIQLDSIRRVFHAVSAWPPSSYRNEVLPEILDGLKRLREDYAQARPQRAMLYRTTEPAQKNAETLGEAVCEALLADAEARGDEQALEGLLALWWFLDWAVHRLPGVLAGLGRKRLRVRESAGSFFAAWIAADASCGQAGRRPPPTSASASPSAAAASAAIHAAKKLPADSREGVCARARPARRAGDEQPVRNHHRASSPSRACSSPRASASASKASHTASPRVSAFFWAAVVRYNIARCGRARAQTPSRA